MNRWQRALPSLIIAIVALALAWWEFTVPVYDNSSAGYQDNSWTDSGGWYDSGGGGSWDSGSSSGDSGGSSWDSSGGDSGSWDSGGGDSGSW